MGSPYATQEDPESLWYEQSNYVSTHLASVAFGIHLGVFATVTYYTLLTRSRSKSRMWIFWLVLNTALFAMGTINLACSIRFNENAWINDREYPSGPFNYLIDEQSVPFMTLGNVASILASFMSDGLLLYRVGVLWNFAWFIVVPPALFFVACIILSVMVVIQIAIPTVPLPELELPVWIVLMLLPIWLTALIAGRILYHRQTMIDVLGPDYAKNYAGISAIVIESAVPFTIISIILLGLFGAQNTAQNLFIPVMVQVECIAPELIVLRVVLGRSWTRKTMSGGGGKPSELEFASPHRRDGASEFDEAALAAAVGTQSTRSQTNEAPRRDRTSLVVLRDAEDNDNEKKHDNPSASTVNVV